MQTQANSQSGKHQYKHSAHAMPHTCNTTLQSTYAHGSKHNPVRQQWESDFTCGAKYWSMSLVHAQQGGTKRVVQSLCSCDCLAIDKHAKIGAGQSNTL